MIDYEKALKVYMRDLELHVLEHITERARLKTALDTIGSLLADNSNASGPLPPARANALHALERLNRMLKN